jgi:hypothetical protein
MESKVKVCTQVVSCPKTLENKVIAIRVVSKILID